MHVSGLGGRGNIITHVSNSSTGAHRGGVGVAPAGGERIDATLGQLNRVEPGFDVLGQVEDRPIVGLDFGSRVFGHLG